MVKHPGDLKRVGYGEFWLTAYDVSHNRVIYIRESPTGPSEVYMWDKGESRLTSYNVELAKKMGLKPLRRFHYKSIGDLGMDAWYIRPDATEDKKAPLVVFIHGDPKAM
jgi:dipeptidyl aminopeptidase/acylaminoacyl peptidase